MRVSILLLALALAGCNDSATTSDDVDDPGSPQEPAPPPQISSFTASPSTITEGETVSLLAVFSDGTGEIDNGVGPVTSDEAATASPAASTTFTLTVTNDDGDSVSASVDVTVEPSPITIEIVWPDATSPSGTELFVGARIESEFDISAVTAQVEGRSIALEFESGGFCDPDGDRCAPGYEGELSLSGLPPGSHVITVTAEDVAGNVASEERSFRLDEPPTITVTEPVNDSVARPELPVEVSCSDDLGDCAITVWDADDAEPRVLATGTNDFSQALDLSEYEGRGIELEFVARDSAGQRSFIMRTVYVDSSPRLINERPLSTFVLDFDGQRALLGHTSGGGDRSIEQSELIIVDVDSGLETVVEEPEAFLFQRTHLSPTGAIYSGEEGGEEPGPDGRDVVYDWNNSTLFELGSGFVEALAGDYAIWSDRTNLWRYQFSTMTTLNVSDAGTEGDVASNGVVVFADIPAGETRYQIVQFDGVDYTVLTADPDDDNVSPVTDGQGVVYRKSGAAGFRIAFHDGTDETVLTTGEFPEEDIPSPNRAFPGKDYAIAGGWVAFIDPGADSQPDVWTRDPSGTVAQRSAFGADTRIDTLAPDGEVMVKTAEKRYLSLPGQPPADATEVSSRLGQSIKIGDTWYVLIGRSLFEVQ